MPLMKEFGRRAALVLGSIVLAILIFEIGARITGTLKDRYSKIPVNPAGLNVYQTPDPRDPRNWLLRPGYSLTLQQAIDDKQKTGRILAVDYLKQRAVKLNVRPNETITQFNQDGFKGPELDKGHSHFRIVTIGDSCTFGSFFDKYSYPRMLEQELRRRGVDAEVINAGIEGYTTRNVLMRLNDFKALRPNLVTVYIGWNNLYGKEPLVGLAKYSYTYRLLRRTFRKMRNGNGLPADALEQYNKPKHADLNASEVRALEGYWPPFVEDVDDIVSEFQKANIRTVIVTLPGLFMTSEPPTDKALQIGHLPFFTDNPYVLARIYEQYNVALRQLAQRRGLQLIDLEHWSKDALSPRDTYFFDSVHLYEEGQEKVGIYMAGEILKGMAGK
jgi:lysophospholipase L1-like esterase